MGIEVVDSTVICRECALNAVVLWCTACVLAGTVCSVGYVLWTSWDWRKNDHR